MMTRLNILIALLVVLAITLILGRNSIQMYLLESRAVELEDSTARSAGQVFNDLVRLDPDNVDYRLRRGRWLISSGRYREALTAADDIIRMSPDSAPAFHLKGVAQLETFDPESALESFLTALELDASDPEFHLDAGRASLKLGLFEDAITYADEAAQLGGETADTHTIRSEAHLGSEDYAAAALDFSAIIELSGENTSLLIERGRCYAETGEEELAVEDVTRAAQSAPEDPEVQLALAALYRDLSRYPEALDQAAVVMEKFPDYAGGYVERSCIFRAAGRPDAALLDLETAMGLDSENVDLFMLAARTYADLFDYRSAASAANSAMYLMDDSDPDRLIGILLEKSRYELERRQPSRAIQDCEQALNIDADNPDALTAMGRAFLVRGNLDDALTQFEAALALDADHVEAQASMAELRVKQNELDRAISYIESVLEKHPDNGRTRMVSAQTALETGRYDRALEDMEIAMRNGLASNPDAYGLYYRVLSAHRDNEGAALARRALESITAWQRDPMDSSRMLLLADMLVGMDLQDEALNVYARQLYRTPDAVEVYLARGGLFMEREEYGLALLDYNEAIALNPNSQSALQNRAEVYARLGDSTRQTADEQAANRIAEAPEGEAASGGISNFQDLADSLGKLARRIERDPGNLIWLSQRADLYGKMRNHEKAIADYTKMIALNSGNPNYYVRRAKHYEELEDFDSALSDYSIALERSPDHQEARQRRITLLIALGRTQEAEREGADLDQSEGADSETAADSDLSNTDVPRKWPDFPVDPINRPQPGEESDAAAEESADDAGDETSAPEEAEATEDTENPEV